MLYIRRITGESMLPRLKPGQIVVALKTRRPRIGTIIIVQHDGIEKIKRLADTRPGDIYILGDNLAASTDSRSFGWLSHTTVKAKVIWPRY